MPLVKAAKPLDIFGAEDWAKLTHISRWRGIALILHGWAVILGAIALAIWSGHWAVWIAAIFVVGGRQLGLSILMHDAAHGLLHPDRKINNFLGKWASGIFTGSDLQGYRSYHLVHHRYTQQAEDPDMHLSKPFPTSRASMIRKVIRDLTGQTFFKQRGAQIKTMVAAAQIKLHGEAIEADESEKLSMGLVGEDVGAADKNKRQTLFIGRITAQFWAVQLGLLALSLISGYGFAPFLIWFIALATVFQLVLRIRNIAEHACTTTGGDDPFSHARTTRANWPERAIIAPYWVNYHSEHHLFMGVPCYSLPKAHKALLAKGYGPKMTLADGYWDVIKTVTQPQAVTG